MTFEPTFEQAREPTSGRPGSDGLELDLAGVDLEAIAREHDTPFFLYDLAVIERRVAALRAILPPSFRLAYAVKANPAPAVLERLAGLGLGADVASGGELERAIAAGFEPARIVLTGPGKRDAELLAAVSAGVGLITVESPGELGRLEAIARSAGRPVDILLRWSVPQRMAGAGSGSGSVEPIPIIDDGGAGKFGMDEDDLRSCARRARDSAWIGLRGLHAFGASNVLDPNALVGHLERTVALACQLAAEFDLRPDIVDGGGGLGIPYADDEPPLDLETLGSGLGRLAGTWGRHPATTGTTVLLEPGRYLVGPAGIYVTRVLDRKRVRGAPIAIVDGGINHLLRPALVGQPQRIRRVAVPPRSALHPGSPSLPDVERVTIAGPLCTGLDILARELPIGLPEVGELLAVLDAGAYGFTESMPLFLSRPAAAEVIVG
ncbi:MAG: diaminopimelate decarboxylase family protein [Candidatus Limnocylindrales bacterium]